LNIKKETSEMNGKLEQISKVLADVVGDISIDAENKGRLPGATTDFSGLDRIIAGLNNAELIILASRPGVGKTSVALSIARHAAATSGKAVAVFSLELSREQLALRLLSRECSIGKQRLQAGCELSPGDWRKIAAAAASLSAAELLIDDTPSLSVAAINAKCRLAENLGLVVIDYIQLIQENSGDIGRRLKTMAKELNVPVLCLSQLSRSLDAHKDKRPMLSDLPKFGSMDQQADIVLGLHRDSYYDIESKNRDIAELIILKNKRGETGTIELQWQAIR
jgi:replicative DNA helicase